MRVEGESYFYSSSGMETDRAEDSSIIYCLCVTTGVVSWVLYSILHHITPPIHLHLVITASEDWTDPVDTLGVIKRHYIQCIPGIKPGCIPNGTLFPIVHFF